MDVPGISGGGAARSGCVDGFLAGRASCSAEMACAYCCDRTDVGRFAGTADSEAIYSYEGTREINTLIVGRAITGLGAFV